MDEHVRGAGFREFLDIFLDTRLPTLGQSRRLAERVADTVSQAGGSVWRIGEPFVLAPAMTAIVAAAAQALDLTGEVVTEQVAPATGECCSCPSRSTTATSTAPCPGWPRSPGRRSAARAAGCG